MVMCELFWIWPQSDPGQYFVIPGVNFILGLPNNFILGLPNNFILVLPQKCLIGGKKWKSELKDGTVVVHKTCTP